MNPSGGAAPSSVTPNAAPIDSLTALKGSLATLTNPQRLTTPPLPWGGHRIVVGDDSTISLGAILR